MANCKPRIWNAEMVARAAGLKRAGFTAKVISERLGVTESAVKNQMKTKGVRSRLDRRGGGNRGIFLRGPIALAKIEATNESIQELIDIKGEQ